MDLLLDVDRHGGHFERPGVLLVLALPDELRVERAVAVVDRLADAVVGGERGRLAGGDVRPLVGDVLVGIDGDGAAAGFFLAIVAPSGRGLSVGQRLVEQTEDGIRTVDAVALLAGDLT